MPPVTTHAYYVQPDLRRKRITISSTSDSAMSCRFAIDGVAGEFEATGSALTIELPEFKTWAPDTPHVYTVKISGEPVTRFGMREFTVKDNRFHLNNRPIMLRGLNCREEISFSDAWLQGVKKAGFNFLRMRGISAPESLLDAADEQGMLICDWVDASDETAAETFVVTRRNRACIVMWDVAARYGDHESRTQAMRSVQKLDPSRIVASGLESLDGQALYMRPYHDDLSVCDVVTAHLPAPSTPRGERYYENVGSPNRTSLITSFGAAIWQKPDPQGAASVDRLLAAREMSAGFTSADKLCAEVDATRNEAVKAQIQSARLNSKLSGYCLDTDGGAAPLSLAAVQAPMLLSLRASRTTLVPREEVPVTVTVVNDERIEPLADLSLQVVGPTNQVLWKKKRSVKVPKQTREIWSGTISASGSVGTHRFVVRLMQGMKLLSQNSLDLHVVEPTTAGDVELSVVDPHRQWSDRLLHLGRSTGAKPRVYVVPPLANTVRGYPDADLLNVLAEVRAGAVALLFGPPNDWNDLAERIDDAIRATTRPAIDAYHYLRLHPVFDGLPSRCLMRQPYRNVAPRAAFEEASDESIAGAMSFHDDDMVWGEDFLVRRFDAGRLVFTHLRLLEHVGLDPVADRLFVNMMRHFGRRSVPSDETPSLPQTVLDWSRRERADRAKLWCVIGPFANWDHSGHETAYPPEQNVDLGAVHAGWRDAVRWLRWFALGDVITEFTIDEGLGLPFIGETSVIPETFYAYAECTAPSRQSAQVTIRTKASVKVFVNGAVCGESLSKDEDSRVDFSVPITLKQGRNNLLIKVSRQRVAAHVTFELTSATRDPLIVKWWR